MASVQRGDECGCGGVAGHEPAVVRAGAAGPV